MTPSQKTAALARSLENLTAMGTQKERPVVVTTSHRGVFFGYASDTKGSTIDLKRARLCVYWSADLHGFMGLASQGPSGGCKIGPAVDIEVRDITSVVECSPEAVKAWESAPWS